MAKTIILHTPLHKIKYRIHLYEFEDLKLLKNNDDIGVSIYTVNNVSMNRKLIFTST